MSSVPQRRPLAIPIALSRSQERPVTLPDVPERRIPSDKEVMARLQAHDVGALEILFERYARLVF
ncbi:MAG TPA: hypothetical protein VJX72_00165, partial [Candidatus Acidoferrum sp.]|nr:hypothetical protein [Candidatus Acidoferrum sp.]